MANQSAMARISASFLLALLSPIAVAAEHHQLSVQVMNLAAVSPAELNRAVIVTTKVFDAAGVHLRWHLYDRALYSLPRDQRSLDRERIGEGVTVWLLNKEASKRVSWKTTVGSAFEAEPGGERNEAAIFYNR